MTSRNETQYWIGRSFRRGVRALPLAALALWAIGGGWAQKSDQQTFATAGDASESLFQAVLKNNLQSVVDIMGGATDLVSCADPAQDRLDRERFVQKYRDMHRLRRDENGSWTLYLGAENWPFPVPLVQENGGWQFDIETGAREVLARRIGENELVAIQICREFGAKRKLHSNTSTSNDMLSVSLVTDAADTSDSKETKTLHGYRFRSLTAHSTIGMEGAKNRKETTLIAYPAEYRSSGVMTFGVAKNGAVYEKDLGANTPAMVSRMTDFHRDSTWRAVSE